MMQKTPKRNKQPLTAGEPALLPPDKRRKGAPADFVALLPPEVSVQIFSSLDLRSLCSAAMTCRRWRLAIDGNDWLWRNHCLTVRAVCQREIDGDRGSGYSWKITLLRNYWKSKVKQEWLSGKYSNVHSQNNLPEKSMYPMDVDTWGEILEAELERWERTAAACNSRTLHQQHMDCQPVNILLFKLVIFADVQRKLHRKKQTNMQITFYLHFIRFTDTKSEILNKTRSLIQ